MKPRASNRRLYGNQEQTVRHPWELTRKQLETMRQPWQIRGSATIGSHKEIIGNQWVRTSICSTVLFRAGPATYLSSTGSLVGSANVWQSLGDEGLGTTLLSRVGPTQHCALAAWMAQHMPKCLEWCFT